MHEGINGPNPAPADHEKEKTMVNAKFWVE